MKTKGIEQRRSIRKYLEKPVEKEKLIQMLEAARLAPSGKNKQPWKFIVFSGKQKEELLLAMDQGIRREAKEPELPDSRYGLPDAKNTWRIMKKAPVVIIILNQEGKSPFQKLTSDERVTEIVDSLSIGAAVENMLIEAQNLGLGTLWIANTCFAYREMTEYLHTKSQLIGAVAVGYSDESPERRPRKNINEIVEFRME